LAIDTQGGSTPVDISDLKDYYKEDKMELYEKGMKEKLCDHLSTEDILQNFASTTSTINLAVTSDLTFEDQRLINKLKRRLEKSSNPGKLIVVHNLFHCFSINQVEKIKLDKLIKPSFNIDEKLYVNSQNDKNNRYWEEKVGNHHVVHLILAKENTEAGDFYNSTSLKYLTKLIETSEQKSDYDIVKEFKDYLKDKLPEYLVLEDGKKQLNYDESESKFYLNLGKEAKLEIKSVQADESGFLDTNTPANSIIIDESKGEVQWIIESPGSDQKSELKVRIEEFKYEYRIWVRGNKKVEEDLGESRSYRHHTRKSGQFLFCSPMLPLRYGVKFYAKSRTTEYINGCYVLTWKYHDNTQAQNIEMNK
jgi:hypothetical protein